MHHHAQETNQPERDSKDDTLMNLNLFLLYCRKLRKGLLERYLSKDEPQQKVIALHVYERDLKCDYVYKPSYTSVDDQLTRVTAVVDWRKDIRFNPTVGDMKIHTTVTMRRFLKSLESLDDYFSNPDGTLWSGTKNYIVKHAEIEETSINLLTSVDYPGNETVYFSQPFSSDMQRHIL